MIFFSWSPNEEFLAFLGRSSKYKDEEIGYMYLYNLKTKLLRKIYSFANCRDYPSPASWNASGDKLYFINKDNMVIEFDIKKNMIRDIVKGKGVYWISESELLIRKKTRNTIYIICDQKMKNICLNWVGGNIHRFHYLPTKKSFYAGIQCRGD